MTNRRKYDVLLFDSGRPCILLLILGPSRELEHSNI